MRSLGASGRTSLRETALRTFERIARAAAPSTAQESVPEATVELVTGDTQVHPFDSRNIHPDLPKKVRRLFGDGYFAEATFEAFKWVDKEVRRISKSRKFGNGMMMEVFSETNAVIKLTPLADQSEIDEQMGYKFIFAGSQSAIRNPRGHDIDVEDSLDQCLDHLALASLLIRRLDDAGVREDQ